MYAISSSPQYILLVFLYILYLVLQSIVMAAFHVLHVSVVVNLRAHVFMSVYKVNITSVD